MMPQLEAAMLESMISGGVDRQNKLGFPHIQYSVF